MSSAAKLQDAHRRVFEVLHQAEVAARICEQERNEGDADAIRRDAIRSVLALGIGESIPSRFEDYWRTHASKL